MIRISDIMDLDALNSAIEEGLVRKQVHPVLPLTIYNYTERAQFTRTWNTVTRQCRGLIAGTDDHIIVARPFPKFFNYGEEELRAELDLLAPCSEVTNKMDGSLGILYPDPSNACGYAIATRGSFTSDQAIRGTMILEDGYINRGWAPRWGYTHLFEIIYPENRIVLDYAGMTDLVMLGSVHVESGLIAGPFFDNDWKGPRTHVFPVNTLAAALKMPPRLNAEGVVVRQDQQMIKIKQDDYVMLHRIITGMNERAVWERLGAGESPFDICEQIPEEFWDWVKRVGYGLLYDASLIMDRATTEYMRIVRELPEGWTRKDFAIRAQQSEYRALLFLLLDERDIFDAVWRTLKPAASKAMVATGEDVA